MKSPAVQVSLLALMLFLFASSELLAQNKQSKSKNAPQTLQNNSQTSTLEMEKAFLNEINEVRGNPKKCVGYLEENKKSVKNNEINLPDGRRITMIEGIPALDDAINEVSKFTKFDAYVYSAGLSKVAARQLSDLMEDSTLGHKGKDGGDLISRLTRYGTVGINYAENISYGAITPRDVLMAMVIDDGVKTRAHRKNIFSARFKLFGVACGVSAKGVNLCVAEFADTFAEREKPLGNVKVF